MRVMGIDPGSLCTGYGIVEETGGRLTSIHFGSIKSQSKNPFAQRLKTIYDGLASVMEEYQPNAVAVEDIFFAANAKSTIKLGQTRGVALLAAAQADITLAEYTAGGQAVRRRLRPGGQASGARHGDGDPQTPTETGTARRLGRAGGRHLPSAFVPGQGAAEGGSVTS